METEGTATEALEARHGGTIVNVRVPGAVLVGDDVGAFWRGVAFFPVEILVETSGSRKRRRVVLLVLRDRR